MTPLQVRLAVQLHHHYASRFLVDSLHHLGFCCSYQQVQEFEQCAAFSHGTDIFNFINQFIQYVADNVDHNIQTLDGNNTYDTSGFVRKWPGTHPTIQPQILPPTSAAAKFHSLRVYYQVQQWKGIGDGLLPENWGWRKS